MSFIVSNFLFAEDAISFEESGSYVYIERTDLRRYDNGKYSGLVNREVRSFMMPVEPPAGFRGIDRFFDGSFSHYEDHKLESFSVNSIDESIPSTFRITPNGEIKMVNDHGYPTFRSFPSFPLKGIKIGDRWQAMAERTVDPNNTGIFTKLPTYVEYTYLKDEKFKGEDVYVLSAAWATRYGISYKDRSGDKNLKFAEGSHKATMYVSKRTGSALVVRDMVDEKFTYNDGSTVAFKGAISFFTEYPPAMDRHKILPALQKIADVDKKSLEKIVLEKKSDKKGKMEKSLENSSNVSGKSGNTEKNLFDDKKQAENAKIADNSGKSPSDGKFAGDRKNTGKSSKKESEKNKNTKKEIAEKIGGKSDDGKVSVENTELGLMLTIRNLQFKPDSAELLPGEGNRIAGIAEVLRQAPESMFLVEGHTASTGNVRGEKNLSMERAKSIMNALVRLGIPSEKFIVKGSGGTKPIADNSTPEGKAKNRRVEITILE